LRRNTLLLLPRADDAAAQMNASIMIHMQDIPAEKCASVKLHAMAVRATRRAAHVLSTRLRELTRACGTRLQAAQAQSREALQGAWKQWVEEYSARPLRSRHRTIITRTRSLSDARLLSPPFSSFQWRRRAPSRRATRPR
jgi:hypothetical protein